MLHQHLRKASFLVTALMLFARWYLLVPSGLRSHQCGRCNRANDFHSDGADTGGRELPASDSNGAPRLARRCDNHTSSLRASKEHGAWRRRH
jgi:hypothetical protein